MQCSMIPRIRYLEAPRMLAKQKEAVHAMIRANSKSHIVHKPPAAFKNGPCKIDPSSIQAISKLFSVWRGVCIGGGNGRITTGLPWSFGEHNGVIILDLLTFFFTTTEDAGWSPEMDELARQPKHGPHYAQLLHLLNEMQNHQSAWPFQKPVNAEEVPDYYNVITEPMDLETMEKRLEEDAYSSPEDFVKDAKLVFNNCRRYNNDTTSYWKNANKLEKFMNSKLREIPEWSVSCCLLIWGW